MATQLVSNDFFISILMALIIAILGFPFIIVILLIIFRNAKKGNNSKK